MGLREILGEPLSKLPIELLEAKNFSGFSLPRSTPEVIHREYLKQLERYRRLGGLPGICLQREDADRTSRHMDLLDLMLDRDLRIILETPLSLSRIHAVLAAIADTNGTPLKLADIQRKSKVSTPTLRKLLTAFEALFLIRTLRLEGGRSAPVVWFEDAGEWSRITGRPSSLDHFLFCQVRLTFSCIEGKRAEYFQYATRGGAAIPVCIRTTAGVLGIMAVDEGELSRSQILSAESFLKHYADSKVLFVHLGREWRRVSDRILMVPMSAF
jgi:predicted AAA+ superfamily ATPase